MVFFSRMMAWNCLNYMNFELLFGERIDQFSLRNIPPHILRRFGLKVAFVS